MTGGRRARVVEAAVHVKLGQSFSSRVQPTEPTKVMVSFDNQQRITSLTY